MGNYSYDRQQSPVRICVSSLTSNDCQASIRQDFAPFFAPVDGLSCLQQYRRGKFGKSVASQML